MIPSTLPENERAASYDQMAAGYDLLVGNGLYNRLVWGCPKSEYARAADMFLQTVSSGALIDFGCGSCVFTAQSYQGHEDRLTLFDRSMGMLERAARRLPHGQFLQGDALGAPFPDNHFAGGMGWGMSHVFGTDSPYFAELHRIVQPGAPIAISTLVLTDHTIGNRMLLMLEKQGEAVPETADQVTSSFAQLFSVAQSRLIGNMLFLVGRKK